MFFALAFVSVSMGLAEEQVTGLNVVVDLSHWNSKVDFVKAKADGIQGVMHKSTQGLSYTDPNYAQRKEQAESIGLKWGAYHFANGSSGVDQAKHFLKVAANDPETLLAIDLEENPTGPTVNLEIAEDMVTTIYAATGRYPLIYGSKQFLKDLINGTKSILLDCPLWFAYWGGQPTLPENTWSQWSLLQYTDGKTGPEPHTVNGIGPCDRDTINNEIYSSIEDMWDNVGKPQATDMPTCTANSATR